MFFQDRYGNSHPIALIERISERKKIVENGQEVWRHIVNLRGGDQVIIHDIDRRTIDRHVVAAWPAGIEEYILHFDAEDEGKLYKTKVLGWAVTAGLGVVPITLDGVNDDSDDSHYVQLSDGTVTRYGAEAWPSLDDFLKSGEK